MGDIRQFTWVTQLMNSEVGILTKAGRTPNTALILQYQMRPHLYSYLPLTIPGKAHYLRIYEENRVAEYENYVCVCVI